MGNYMQTIFPFLSIPLILFFGKGKFLYVVTMALALAIKGLILVVALSCTTSAAVVPSEIEKEIEKEEKELFSQIASKECTDDNPKACCPHCHLCLLCGTCINEPDQPACKFCEKCKFCIGANAVCGSPQAPPEQRAIQGSEIVKEENELSNELKGKECTDDNPKACCKHCHLCSLCTNCVNAPNTYGCQFCDKCDKFCDGPNAVCGSPTGKRGIEMSSSEVEKEIIELARKMGEEENEAERAYEEEADEAERAYEEEADEED